MREFKDDFDRLMRGSHQERMDYIYNFLTAPITYAKELKEAVSAKVGGGLRGEALGYAAAIAPIIIPLIFPISAVLRGGNIGAGILGGVLFWAISSATVYVLHDEGAIGPKKG